MEQKEVKYKGLQGLKDSKRATTAFATFLISLLYPLVMSVVSYFLNQAGVQIDLEVYSPIVLGAINIIAGILIFGYTIEDSIEKYKQDGAINPISINESTGDILNVVGDYIEDGHIEEETN